LDILNSPGNYIQRSDSVILVKNIPFNTTAEDLKSLFSPYGELGRVLLPPSNTVAIVEFMIANEAKKAFRTLAYRKFKNVPLFLEWAPVGFFIAAPPKAKAEKPAEADAEQARALGKEGIITGLDDEDVQTSTVYIKNINFQTNEEKLKEVMDRTTGLRSVRVAMKNDPTGKKLSMGYGFAEYNTKELAVKAIKNLQGVSLDGHALEMRISAAQKKQTEAQDKRKAVVQKKETPKLMVRNLPFEATNKDLRDIFSVFGQIKAVRVPKKPNGKHRGFAFVEFLTIQEAKKAMESVKHTHLYGRHLVLEFADEDASLEAIREKTAKHFAAYER